MYAVFVLGSNSALALLTASASVISPGGTSSTDWTILRMPCASSDEIPFPPKRLAKALRTAPTESPRIAGLSTGRRLSTGSLLFLSGLILYTINPTFFTI